MSSCATSSATSRLTKVAGIVEPVLPAVPSAPDVDRPRRRGRTTPSSSTPGRSISTSQQQARGGPGQVPDSDLARLLRVPTGWSAAAAQRFVVTWDRRDNSFNAHQRHLLAAGVEHVDSERLRPSARVPDAARRIPPHLRWCARTGTTSPPRPRGPGPNNPCDPREATCCRSPKRSPAISRLTKRITLAGESGSASTCRPSRRASPRPTASSPGSVTYPRQALLHGWHRLDARLAARTR